MPVLLDEYVLDDEKLGREDGSSSEDPLAGGGVEDENVPSTLGRLNLQVLEDLAERDMDRPSCALG